MQQALTPAGPPPHCRLGHNGVVDAFVETYAQIPRSPRVVKNLAGPAIFDHPPSFPMTPGQGGTPHPPG